ncbi:MAG: HNH endonuclease [Acholeplasmataceae bacterium]|nr:HNH endonuclease [Acholeplasmataceae bacterium]
MPKLNNCKCKQCGHEFYRNPSAIKHGRGIFCSVKCKSQWMSENRIGKNNPTWIEKVKTHCKFCGKEFNVSQRRRKFCTKKCYMEYLSQQSGENSPRWTDKVLKICKWCGKEFYVKQSMDKKNGGKFCSQECYGAWRIGRFTKENSPNWKHELSDEDRTKSRDYEEYRKWRIDVLERDNYTCQDCGIRGGVLEVHHIVGFARNKELRVTVSNGITLCKKCHKMRHRKNKNQNKTT